MKENSFQSGLKKEIKGMFPGCYVLKNDGSNVPQGFPDISIHYNGTTAFLECKKDQRTARSKSGTQPNQEEYLDRLTNKGFYAKFVYPENKEEILHDLERLFKTERNTLDS